MRKRLKYIALILALVVVIVLLVVYCNSDYALYWFGNWYLHVDNSSVVDRDPHVYHDILFDSVSEMRHKILTGDFTESELEIIKSWADNKGRVPLFDLFNLYEPVYPSSFSTDNDQVYWFVNRYGFNADDNNGTHVNMHFSNQEKHNEDIDRLLNYKDFLLAKLSTRKVKVNYCEDRNATEYIYSSGIPTFEHMIDKDVIYQIENHNTTYTVKEHYDCEDSSTIPYSVTIYVPIDGQFLFINLYNFSERPSVKWLSQFGVKKFEG